MTEAEFFALPHREKDALVADKVLGLKPVKTVWGKDRQYSDWSLGEPEYYDDHGAMELYNPLPTYTSDIAAAFEIIGHVHRESAASETTLKQHYDGLWLCVLSGVGEERAYRGEALNCDSAPLAISIAALKAVGAIK